MKRKFKTIKTPVSYKEKIERAKFYNEFNGEEKINVEELPQGEIFEESVLMKCSKCSYEETAELDIMLEIMEMHEMDYPILEGTKSSHTKKRGTVIPIDIYNEDK